MMKHYILKIKDFLSEKGFCYDESIVDAMTIDCKSHDLSDHVRFLVYALLSNQREWGPIEDNYENIRGIFFEWNVAKIKEHDADYFLNKILEIKCGNRSIKSQMNDLRYNISVLERIQSDFGSIDDFISSENPDIIVKLLSNNNSEYKVKGLGPALAQEYLRNTGISMVKADLHLKRFLGNERMGNSKGRIATNKEVEEQTLVLSKETGLELWQIDQIIWQFCSTSYANICGAKPQCINCSIKEECSKKNVKIL